MSISQDSEERKNEHLTEIYRQRYETWRHLDQTRWKLLSFVVGIFGLAIAALKLPDLDLTRFTGISFGVALGVMAVAMLKVDKGIRENNKALSKIASAVGDEDFPDTSDNTKSISFWIAIGVLVGSMLLIGWSLVIA